jgi:hypothetical protein
VLFMDPYVVYYPRERRNLCVSPTSGICGGPDTRWDNFRDNLGYILRYSRKLNLANVTPRPALCSTLYCLAETPSKGAEYLVYAPSGGPFTMDLSAMVSSRTLAVEWFNPSTGLTIAGEPIPSGSTSQSFTPPFSGDAVLYLMDTAGHATGNPGQPAQPCCRFFAPSSMNRAGSRRHRLWDLLSATKRSPLGAAPITRVPARLEVTLSTEKPSDAIRFASFGFGMIRDLC